MKLLKYLSALVALMLGFFAALFAPPAVTREVANSATQQTENLWRVFQRAALRGMLEVQFAIDRIFGMRTPFALGVTETADDKILKALDEQSQRFKKFEGLAEEMKLIKDTQEKSGASLTEMQKQMIAYQKHQLELTAGRDVRRSRDGIADSTARFLGGVYLANAIANDNEGRIKGGTLELYKKEIKSILGIDLDVVGKSALTTSDIPLTTQYSGDIVELVFQYGLARKIGTVMPIGASAFKLPKLSSSPTFSIIASSGTVTEKSPQIAFTTFTPDKFGGLIRLPSEIEDDSIVGMGQFLARYSARQTAQVEDYNFFRSTGAGSGQNGNAKGLTVSCNASNDNVVYSQSGSATGGKTKQSDMTLADLRALRGVTALNAAVLRNAKYAMHPSYESTLAGFNTSATVVPYRPATGTTPATLDGFEIVWVPDMPAMSTSASASLGHVLFGDFTFNYLGVRGGPRFDISREAGFTTDEVLVRALERFTIGKMATDCVAVLLNDAS